MRIMPKLHGSDWFLGWRIQTQSVDHCPFPPSLCECHMLARLAQSVRERQQRQMKTGHGRKYHQRNGDRHGKRAKSDTHWFLLGKWFMKKHTH